MHCAQAPRPATAAAPPVPSACRRPAAAPAVPTAPRCPKRRPSQVYQVRPRVREGPLSQPGRHAVRQPRHDEARAQEFGRRGAPLRHPRGGPEQRRRRLGGQPVRACPLPSRAARAARAAAGPRASNGVGALPLTLRTAPHAKMAWRLEASSSTSLDHNKTSKQPQLSGLTDILVFPSPALQAGRLGSAETATVRWAAATGLCKRASTHTTTSVRARGAWELITRFG